MKKITLALLLLLPLLCLSQVPNWQWARNYELYFNDICRYTAVDPQGNVYLAGDFGSANMQVGATTLTNAGVNSADIYLIKFSSLGDVIWAKSFGGTQQESLKGIQTDSSGNLYLVGKFTYNIALGDHILTSTGATDFFAKFDGNGNPIWAKSATESLPGWGAASLNVDAEGNVFVAGFYISSTLTFGDVTLNYEGTDNAATGHAFTGKFDSGGNCLWLRGSRSDVVHSAGSTAMDVATGSDGSVVAVGWFANNSISFGNITLTKTGTDQWNRNLFIVKYDGEGNVQWATNAGTTTAQATNATSVIMDHENNVVLSGYFLNTINLGGIVLDAGASSSSFVAKFNAEGLALWATNVQAAGCGSTHDDTDLDADGNVYVSGFTGCSFLGFGNGISLNLSGQGELYVAKYNADGTAAWARKSGPTTSANRSAIAVYAPNEIYVAGTFSSPTIGFGTTTLTKSDSTFDLFLAKLFHAPLANDGFESATFKIYPNPASEFVEIAGVQQAAYSISDLAGKIIRSGQVSSGNTRISLSGMARGVYVISITNANGTEHLKLVRE